MLVVTTHALWWNEASLVAQTVKNLPVMGKTQVQSLGWEDPLEKEMATHSNILAWRIPWTEDPGGVEKSLTLSLFSTNCLGYVGACFATILLLACFRKHHLGKGSINSLTSELNQSSVHLFYKAQDGKYFRLCAHVVSVTTALLCHSSIKTVKQQVNKWFGFVPIKLYLLKQPVGPIWSMAIVHLPLD